MEPRAFTEDEVREKLLRHVWNLVDYWHGDFDTKVAEKTCREKLEGLAFSMLVVLDGESADMPGFVLAPFPHPDDQEWHERRGENWYPDNSRSTVQCDIAGELHDLFHKTKPTNVSNKRH